jgi:hypothetical protein
MLRLTSLDQNVVKKCCFEVNEKAKLSKNENGLNVEQLREVVTEKLEN